MTYFFKHCEVSKARSRSLGPLTRSHARALPRSRNHALPCRPQAVRSAVAPCFSMTSLKRVRGAGVAGGDEAVSGGAPRRRVQGGRGCCCPRPCRRALALRIGPVNPACSAPLPRTTPLPTNTAPAPSPHKHTHSQTFPWLLRLCQLAADEVGREAASGPVDVADLAARVTSDTIGDMLLRWARVWGWGGQCGGWGWVIVGKGGSADTSSHPSPDQ